MLSSLSFALCLASSEVLGLFNVACNEDSVYVTNIRYIDKYLQTTSNVIGVLVSARLGCSLNFTTVVGVVDNLAGMLLRLLRCVWVASVHEEMMETQHDILGLLRFALWPPMTFPVLADMLR
jgi:hypothetical protein